MTFNITDVSTSCCRSRIASGENDMRSALADRKSLIPFAAAGVRGATISVCFPTTVTGGMLVLLEIEFRSCPADPSAAGRGRWSWGFIDCFLTCSAVLANSFGERLVLFFALVRPVPDFVRVREFFRSPELITSSCFGWLVRDARATSTHAIKANSSRG
jgi:hypothetical protein